MYYQVITMTNKVGERFQGVQHAKKLATFIKDNYNLDCELLGNLAGPLYRTHFVTKFESLAQFEELNAKLHENEEYLNWFNESTVYFEFSEAVQNLYEVY